jgi:hypothetical protein
MIFRRSIFSASQQLLTHSDASPVQMVGPVERGPEDSFRLLKRKRRYDEDEEIALFRRVRIKASINIPSKNSRPVPSVAESDDEEPYTLKCICNYPDDDGNTIYCEECDTWQHISCYYHDRLDDALSEEFNHYCVDCKPRPLDIQGAIERQRRNRVKQAMLPNRQGSKPSPDPYTMTGTIEKQCKPETNSRHDMQNRIDRLEGLILSLMSKEAASSIEITQMRATDFSSPDEMQDRINRLEGRVLSLMSNGAQRAGSGAPDEGYDPD